MAKNLLIVDDSATIRGMLRRAITIMGLDVGEVYEAANGIEALAQLADHSVAAVITDINMPTMNGIELIKRMKANPHLKHIPLVVATTDGSQQRIDEMRQYGACGYIRKPFQPEQIRDALKPLFGVKDNAGTDDGHLAEGLF